MEAPRGQPADPRVEDVLDSEEAATFGFRAPASSGLWAVDLLNSNAWDSLRRHGLARSKADAFIFQEHKLHKTATITVAKAAAYKFGWKAHLSSARRTSLGGSSSGVGVAVRRCSALQPHDSVAPKLSCRVGGAWCSGFMRGGVHILTVYYRDGSGMCSFNKAVIQELAALVETLRGPWILGSILI